jgi:hypothetical protein
MELETGAGTIWSSAIFASLILGVFRAGSWLTKSKLQHAPFWARTVPFRPPEQALLCSIMLLAAQRNFSVPSMLHETEQLATKRTP